MLLRFRHGLGSFPARPSSTAGQCSALWRCPASVYANDTQRSYSADSTSPPQHNIAVLGGGISGLATAYYLSKSLPRAQITIFESADRVGGWLSSSRVPVGDGSVVFEAGVRTLRPDGNGVLAAQLTQELGLARDTIFAQKTSPAALNRYVYYPDHLVRMPHPAHGLAENLWSILTEPVFKSVIWSLLTENTRAARDPSIEDESVGDFISRRLGPDIVDRMVSAVMHGIYAGDVWTLSAKSLLPAQWRMEEEYGSLSRGVLETRANGRKVTKRDADFVQDMNGFNWEPQLLPAFTHSSVFTYKDGMGMLGDRLAEHLFSSGQVEFKMNSRVQAITSADNGKAITVETANAKSDFTQVISTLSPNHFNKIAKSNSASTQLIPDVPMAAVMTVNLFYPTTDLHEPGFGYLIPSGIPFEQNPERALGVVFDSAYSPSARALDRANWREDIPMEELEKRKEAGQALAVDDFFWYNFPDAPNRQDHNAPGTKLTVMLGGHMWNHWTEYPDEQEGLALARSVVARHLKIKDEPAAWQVNMLKDCIPQYTVGHDSRLKQAHLNLLREYQGRVRMAGNWISGAGVNDCLRSAYEVAKNLNFREATGLEHIGAAATMTIKPETLRK